MLRRILPVQPVARVGIIAVAVIMLVGIARLAASAVAGSIRAVYGDVVVTAFHTNGQLRHHVAELESSLASHGADSDTIAVLQAENTELKAELGRATSFASSQGSPKGILANVITIPNRSVYDTFLIDAGMAEGVTAGQQVSAFGAVAIGTIAAVNQHTATVMLYSAPDSQIAGNATEGDVAVSLIGRGAGEYEVHMPRSVHFTVGDAISTQSVTPLILARIEKIETDPRDPFQRLLAKAPVTLSSLKWVIVR